MEGEKLVSLQKPYVSVRGNMERYVQLKRILEDDDLIREGKLRNLTSVGIPDGAGLRGIIWRILLRYFPSDKSEWESEITMKRDTYNDMCTQHFNFNTTPENRVKNETELIQENEISKENVDNTVLEFYGYRFIDENTSQEKSADIKLLNEIIKDVSRTRHDIAFFNDQDPTGCENKRKLLRILFVFAKLHSTISYIQGMNEICSALLYVFGTDENTHVNKFAEEDCYYCFAYIISLHKGRWTSFLMTCVSRVVVSHYILHI